MTLSNLNFSPEYLAETQAPALQAVCIVFLVLITMFTILWFAACYYQKASWGWDDFFMLLSWIMVSALCIDALGKP